MKKIAISVFAFLALLSFSSFGFSQEQPNGQVSVDAAKIQAPEAKETASKNTKAKKPKKIRKPKESVKKEHKK